MDALSSLTSGSKDPKETIAELSDIQSEDFRDLSIPGTSPKKEKDILIANRDKLKLEIENSERKLAIKKKIMPKFLNYCQMPHELEKLMKDSESLQWRMSKA